MKSILPGVQMLYIVSLITLFLLSMVNPVVARGYGSGDRVGENFSDYAPREKIRLFAKYDLDESGYLSLDEAAKLNMPAETFNQADLDQNGKLSRSEFSRIRIR